MQTANDRARLVARMTHRRINELEEQERQSIERWRNQRD